MSFEWKGVFPALLTPFTEKEELDLDMYEKNLAAQVAAGVHGIIIGGSLGEASTIAEKEKEELVEFSVEYLNEDIPVILNIAESTTRDAIRQARMQENGELMGSCYCPPCDIKLMTGKLLLILKLWLRQRDLPIMIYNNPPDYKIDTRPDMFDELVECENITALKESSRDVTNLTRMNNRFGDRIKVLCGVDTLAMEELCLGADGWVAGLVDAFPKETIAIYNLVKAGKIEEATKIYRWFMPLLELDIHSKLVQYIKLAAKQTGIGSEYVRAPRLTLDGEERERVLKIINDGIVFKTQYLIINILF